MATFACVRPLQEPLPRCMVEEEEEEEEEDEEEEEEQIDRGVRGGFCLPLVIMV